MVLTKYQVDVIGEILSLGISRASLALVELVHDNVTIVMPSIAIMPVHDVEGWLRSKSNLATSKTNSPYLTPTAILRFHGPLCGVLALVFPIESAICLASALRVEPTAAGLREVVEETGNLLLNAVAGCLANCLDYELTFDTPHYTDAAAVIADFGCDQRDRFDQILIAHTSFTLTESTIEGQILFHLDRQATQALTAAIEAMAGKC